MKMKCRYCGKKWDYTGKKVKDFEYVACPRCHYTNNLGRQKIVEGLK